MQYAEVVVDAPTSRRTFHYAIPPDLLAHIRVGSLVKVPLRAREVDGVVTGLSTRLPGRIGKGKLRSVARVVVAGNVLTDPLLELAHWMADYYLCHPADALFCLLPPFPRRRQPVPERVAEESRGDGRLFFLKGRQQDRWDRYLALLERVLADGRRAIVILPDKDRLEGLRRLLRDRTTWRLAVYSGDLPVGRRFSVWREIRSGRADVVLGTRSAVFAPQPALGLMIVDEDPHPGLKEEQHPRYHVREVALARARLEGARVVVGNLLPSLPVYQEIVGGRIRVIETNPPAVPTTIVAAPGRHLFAPAVEEALQAAGRAIVFTPKIGIGAATRCLDCGHLFRCPRCTLPLTLHRGGFLLCHHCGHRAPLPATCPTCGGHRLRAAVSGTEGLEEHLTARFPTKRVARLEAHTAPLGAWDILVASVKILDTPLTAPLVVAFYPDTLLELPDPFAVERAAQLIIQLRARAEERFLIQTRLPDHRVFAVLSDEEQFLTDELSRRRAQRYPPAVTLVRLLLAGTDQYKVARRLADLADVLRSRLSARDVSVLGPGPALYTTLKGSFRWHLLLKLHRADPALRHTIRALLPADVSVDVNPVDLL